MEANERAIPREEVGNFTLESKNVSVCQKHFDVTDIVSADDFVMNGEVVSFQCDRPKPSAVALPRIFKGLPAYLSKLEPHFCSVSQKQTSKTRCRDLSPIFITDTPCRNTFGTAGAAPDSSIHKAMRMLHGLVACPFRASRNSRPSNARFRFEFQQCFLTVLSKMVIFSLLGGHVH